MSLIKTYPKIFFTINSKNELEPRLSHIAFCVEKQRPMSLYIATALVDTFSIRANGRTTMSVTAPHLRSFSISRSNYNTLGLGLTQGEPLPTKKYGGSRNGKLERMEQSGRSELKIGSGGERSRCIASQRAHASRRMQAEGAVNRLFDSAPFCMDGDSPRNLDRKNSGYQQDYPQAGPSREGIRPTQRDHGGARSTSSIINDRRGMESIINDRRGMESRSSPLRNLPERAPGVGPAGSYCTVIKVSGLPDTITKEELKEAYAKFGDVRSVRLCECDLLCTSSMLPIVIMCRKIQL